MEQNSLQQPFYLAANQKFTCYDQNSFEGTMLCKIWTEEGRPCHNMKHSMPGALVVLMAVFVCFPGEEEEFADLIPRATVGRQGL